MKNLLIPALSTLLLTIGAQSAFANTFEGTIKGAQCHFDGKFCSTDKHDPHAGLENDFLLVTSEGYFFLPNLSHTQKLALNNETVKVNGDSDKFQIDVSLLQVKKGSQYKVVWDRDELEGELNAH